MIKCLFVLLTFVLLSYIPFAFGKSAREKKKRIAFIINPISYAIRGVDIQKIIEKNLDLSQFEYKIFYTEYAGHATKLTQDALNVFDIVAAVGGDGTVNEVGKALIHTQASLAIIPVGSGNGLARHLKIPIGLSEAVKALNYAVPVVIDTAKINDKPFLGVAGIGFDANIAEHFSQFGKRGFLSYCQVVMQEFPHYKPQMYSISLDGEQIERKAFILTFANSSQYGNNFIIAPKAHVNDGYLDLVIVDDISVFSIPHLIYNFKQGTLDQSRHFETYPFQEIIIQYPSMQAHIDGEPLLFKDEIKVTVQPASLKVMIP